MSDQEIQPDSHEREADPSPTDGSASSSDTFWRPAALVLAVALIASNLPSLQPPPSIEQDHPILPKKAQRFPDSLPRAVKRQAASALKVFINSDLNSNSEGSGVKIGPDLVLTAGHVVLEYNPSGELECAGSYTLNKYSSSPGNEDQITDWSAAYDTNNDTSDEDIGVLRIRKDKAFDRLPTARISSQTPVKGQAVFFINYETGGPSSNVDYYPNTGEANYWDGKNYGHAAEYAGTVLGRQGPDLVIDTGLKGYGPRAGRQVVSHDGASGGEIVNEEGQVVAIDVAENGGETAAGITRDYDVSVPASPKAVLQLDLAQPVTPALARRFIDKLSKKPGC